MFQAIVFDMDGVIVDSEPVINAAAIAGLKEYGIQACAEDFIPFIGTGEDRYIGGVAEKYGLSYKTDIKERVYGIYFEMIKTQLNPFPGIYEFLIQLKNKGFRLALASSADHIKIKANLSAVHIDSGLFQTIIGGEDIQRKKPFPDIYSLVSRKLNCDPKGCLVIEDALNGIQAARAAGMACAALTHSFTREQLLFENPDVVVSHFSELYEWILSRSPLISIPKE